MFVIHRVSNSRVGGGVLTHEPGEVVVVQLGELVADEGEFHSYEKAARRVSELEESSTDKFTVVEL